MSYSLEETGQASWNKRELDWPSWASLALIQASSLSLIVFWARSWAYYSTKLSITVFPKPSEVVHKYHFKRGISSWLA